jgi:hypothetical protein
MSKSRASSYVFEKNAVAAKAVGTCGVDGSVAMNRLS